MKKNKLKKYVFNNQTTSNDIILPKDIDSIGSSDWSCKDVPSGTIDPKRKNDANISCLNVARYILNKFGPMSALKLQKLVYYCQAWSLVWDERPLFNDRIEAWVNGPVAPLLYERHRGKFEVSPSDISEDTSNIDPLAQETIDAVLKVYGDKSAIWLSELTHSESPWKEARQGLPENAPGHKEITHGQLAEYYSSL